MKELRGRLCILLCACLLPAWADDISLMAIMGSRATLLINGKPLTLGVGESRNEVKLLTLTEDGATLEIAGKKQPLKLGQGAYQTAASRFNSGSAPKATVFSDSSGHFYANVSTSNGNVRGMIDTGATFLSISQVDAQRLGIKYENGSPISMRSAQGIMRAYLVKATEIKVEGIPLNNIDVVVSPGSFPEMPLIGMSVLNHMDTKRDGSTMLLTKIF